MTPRMLRDPFRYASVSWPASRIHIRHTPSCDAARLQMALRACVCRVPCAHATCGCRCRCSTSAQPMLTAPFLRPLREWQRSATRRLSVSLIRLSIDASASVDSLASRTHFPNTPFRAGSAHAFHFRAFSRPATPFLLCSTFATDDDDDDDDEPPLALSLTQHAYHSRLISLATHPWDAPSTRVPRTLHHQTATPVNNTRIAHCADATVS